MIRHIVPEQVVSTWVLTAMIRDGWNVSNIDDVGGDTELVKESEVVVLKRKRHKALVCGVKDVEGKKKTVR